MSKIDELIKRLCPNGVEYKKLREVCEVKRGERVTKSQLIENGKYPVISGGMMPMGFLNSYNRESNTITIAQYGTAGYVNWQNSQFWANDVCYSLFPYQIINNRYLFYILKNKQIIIDKMVNRDAVPYHLPQVRLENLNFAVPPIEIQQEIVRILDNFSKLTAELQEKLQAELQARKEQYEYYRDAFYGGTLENMLSNIESGKIKAKKLSDLGTFVRGKRFVRADVVEEGYPCIHYGDMYTYYGVKADKTKTFIKEEKAAKLRFAEKGDVVIVGAGENKEDIGVGLAWLGEDSPAVHDACFIYKHSNELNPMYISYFLRTRVYHMQIHRHVVEAKICSLAADKIGTALIPVPPIEEQERIVSILDKFEALVNDLSSGLPAEIAALQEQYEYYRNKLLTFEKAV